MVERTEEEKLVQAPIEVTLGGEVYKVSLLVIRDSREWRKKIISLIAPLPGMLATNTEDPDKFSDVLTTMMVTMPDQVADLFFEYAKDLDRETIEANATDNELAKAFEKVVEVAFPLVESLPKVMGRLAR